MDPAVRTRLAQCVLSAFEAPLAEEETGWGAQRPAHDRGWGRAPQAGPRSRGPWVSPPPAGGALGRSSAVSLAPCGCREERAVARNQPTGWGEAPRPIAGPEGRRVARGPSAIGRLSLHLIMGTGRRSAQTAQVRAGAEPGAQVSRPPAPVWAARRWVRAGGGWTDRGARAGRGVGWAWRAAGAPRRSRSMGRGARACGRAKSGGPGASGMLVPWRSSGAPWASRDGAEPGECLLGRGDGFLPRVPRASGCSFLLRKHGPSVCSLRRGEPGAADSELLGIDELQGGWGVGVGAQAGSAESCSQKTKRALLLFQRSPLT